MTDDAVAAAPGVPIEGEAKSHAHLTDTMTAELSGPDRTPPKGPDPAEWGEEQLVPSPGQEQVILDHEVRGPDPAKWGTDEEREAAEQARIAQHVAEAEAAGTVRTDPGPESPVEVQTVGTGDVANVVLGAVAPPETPANPPA